MAWASLDVFMRGELMWTRRRGTQGAVEKGEGKQSVTR